MTKTQFLYNKKNVNFSNGLEEPIPIPTYRTGIQDSQKNLYPFLQTGQEYRAPRRTCIHPYKQDRDTGLLEEPISITTNRTGYRTSIRTISIPTNRTAIQGSQKNLYPSLQTGLDTGLLEEPRSITTNRTGTGLLQKAGE